MKLTRTYLLASIWLLLSAGILLADTGPVRRIGMFVGANNGGRSRVTLRWAASDAQKMAQVMNEIGSISMADTYYLAEPSLDQVIDSLEGITRRIQSSAASSRRVEFIFYYSGHSDDLGLLIGEDRLLYTSLRQLIQDAGADVTVAILDGCESGAFTRRKGGERIQPFLTDESSDMKGFAFLTSSSDSEASQESDRIQASFFTHFVVSGLRGAADTTQSGRVTLNELYHYAFRETLAMTSSTTAGPQHPSYDIQLSGTGDVVLTDISRPESALHFASEVSGRVLIRAESGNILSEFQKSQGSERVIVVPPGTYEITLSGADSARQGTFSVTRNSSRNIAIADLQLLRSQGITRARGQEEPDRDGFRSGIGLFPPLMWSFSLGEMHPRDYNISVSALSNRIQNLNGVAVGGIYQHISGNSVGLQIGGIASVVAGDNLGISIGGIYQEIAGNSYGISLSGLYGKISGNTAGIQASGLVSHSQKVIGLQTAPFTRSDSVTGAQVGLLNQAGTVYGTQIGLVNIADDVYGLPIGIINYIRNGINDVSVWFEDDELMKFGFRNGTRNIYSLFFMGFDKEESWKDLNHLIAGTGVGVRIYLPGPFVADIDVSMARAARGATANDRISSMVSPGEAFVFPVARIQGGLQLGRIGLFAGAALYGDFEGSERSSGPSRYHQHEDPSYLTTPWGTMAIHPRFYTGFNF